MFLKLHRTKYASQIETFMTVKFPGCRKKITSAPWSEVNCREKRVETLEHKSIQALLLKTHTVPEQMPLS